MPTGRNVDALQVEKAIEVAEHEHVDVALVEWLDRLVVLMRIADRQFTGLGLRDHHVDAQTYVIGKLSIKAMFQGGEHYQSFAACPSLPEPSS